MGHKLHLDVLVSLTHFLVNPNFETSLNKILRLRLSKLSSVRYTKFYTELCTVVEVFLVLFGPFCTKVLLPFCRYEFVSYDSSYDAYLGALGLPAIAIFFAKGSGERIKVDAGGERWTMQIVTSECLALELARAKY